MCVFFNYFEYFPDWIYYLQMGSKCLVIGISGATCSGKTTLARLLNKIIRKSVAINQDQFYWDEESEYHILAEGVNHINWELVTAFNNDKLLAEIKSHSNKNSDPQSSTVTNVDLDCVNYVSKVNSHKYC